MTRFSLLSCARGAMQIRHGKRAANVSSWLPETTQIRSWYLYFRLNYLVKVNQYTPLTPLNTFSEYGMNLDPQCFVWPHKEEKCAILVHIM